MNRENITNPETEQVNRAAGTVGFYTLLSRVLGLVRDMVVAGFFGAGLIADAFYVAFRIPNLLRRLFAEGSLTIAFIPVFTEYLSKGSREEAFRMARAVLSLLSLILVIVTLLGILFSPWIVRLQAFGFGGAGIRYDLTVLLTRITFPYILLVSLVAFFMGILNCLRHFGSPAASPIFLNVGMIAATLWISPFLKEPIVGLALGVIIGGVMQVLLQIPWLIRNGLGLALYWKPDHPAVKRIGRLMLPAVFGSAIYQLNLFVGTLLASFLPEGSISWLYYADRLVEFPLGVFAIAISTAALPSLSRQAANSDITDFRRTLEHSLNLVLFITIPSMAGLMIMGEPIIRVFFERGAFDPRSTIMTAEALFYYAAGLWAFAGIRVLVSAFYAFQDTKTPVKVAAITMVANIAFSVVFMGPLKHGGLALALSLASTLQFCLLAAFLRRRQGILSLKSLVVSGSISLMGSAVMSIILYYLSRIFLLSQKGQDLWLFALTLVGIILVGVTIYFAMARLLCCSELASIIDMVRPFFRHRRAVRRKNRGTANP